MYTYSYSCNRLPLIKNCCFSDTHFYSNNLSTIATFS